MTNQITRARQQQDRPSLTQVVQRMQPEIARALPKHMDADRMARLALTVLRQTPKLADTTAESFAGALLTASALGLEPGVNGEAYLVPHGRECTLIIGYQGMVKLFWQHPLARHIDAQPVHANDDFSYAYGLTPHLTHTPARGDRGPVTDYYAVASLTTGATVFLVASAEEVKRLRGGKVGSNGGIPDPLHWMERKTMLRQLVKMLPKSTSLQNAVAADERSGSDLAAQKVPEQIAAGDPTPAIETAAESVEQIDPVTGEVQDGQAEDATPVQEPEGWR